MGSQESALSINAVSISLVIVLGVAVLLICCGLLWYCGRSARTKAKIDSTTSNDPERVDDDAGDKDVPGAPATPPAQMGPAAIRTMVEREVRLGDLKTLSMESMYASSSPKETFATEGGRTHAITIVEQLSPSSKASDVAHVHVIQTAKGNEGERHESPIAA